jgi:hypothetical protein
MNQLWNEQNVSKNESSEKNKKKKIVKWTGSRKRLTLKRTSTLNTEINKFVLRRQKQGCEALLFEKLEANSIFSPPRKEIANIATTEVDHRNGFALPEKERIDIKAERVKSYWSSKSLLIPNVFRITCLIENSKDKILEYQDLSRKEVLAQNGGWKFKNESIQTSKSDGTCNYEDRFDF